jgi:hypothetical protein
MDHPRLRLTERFVSDEDGRPGWDPSIPPTYPFRPLDDDASAPCATAVADEALRALDHLDSTLEALRFDLEAWEDDWPRPAA